MAINYITALKTTRMQDVIDAIDIGTAGTLEIATAAFATVLAIVPLSHPSFSVSGDTITLLGVPHSVAAANSGTAAVARIKTSAGTVIVNNMSVGTSATDVVLNSTTIMAGQTVTITAGSIEHSA